LAEVAQESLAYEAEPRCKGGVVSAGRRIFAQPPKKKLGGEPIGWRARKASDPEIDCARADGPWGHGDAGKRMAASLGQLEEVEPSFKTGPSIFLMAGFCWRCPRLLVRRTVEPYEQILQPACRLLWSQDDLSAVGFHVAGSESNRSKPCAIMRRESGGKLLGVDRAPEVRTIRSKVKHLADQQQAFFLERRAWQRHGWPRLPKTPRCSISTRHVRGLITEPPRLCPQALRRTAAPVV